MDKAALLMWDAGRLASKAEDAAKEGDIDKAATLARNCERMGNDAINTLTAAGAMNPVRVRCVPVRSRSKPATDPFDLSALETLDTPDARKLLALLEEAQTIADRVDESRGKALASSAGLLPGESRGTDLAEAVSLIALRLRTEVFGPTGGRRE